MFGRKISGERLKLTVWISSAVYAAVAALYFIPGGSDYEIVFPSAVLALFSLWLVPVPMSIALAASAAGDLMGAAGNFMVQMECFAVANLFLCLFYSYFLPLIRNNNRFLISYYLYTQCEIMYFHCDILSDSI